MRKVAFYPGIFKFDPTLWLYLYLTLLWELLSHLINCMFQTFYFAFFSLDFHELWRSMMSICLFTEVKQQWATLVLGWVTASVHYSCLWWLFALASRPKCLSALLTLPTAYSTGHIMTGGWVDGGKDCILIGQSFCTEEPLDVSKRCFARW